MKVYQQCDFCRAYKQRARFFGNTCALQDGYALNQNDDEEVTQICGALYDMSAKCNKYMGYEGKYAVSIRCLRGMERKTMLAHFSFVRDSLTIKRIHQTKFAPSSKT